MEEISIDDGMAELYGVADDEHAPVKDERKWCGRSSLNRIAPQRHGRYCDLVLSYHIEVTHCGAGSDHNNDALDAVAEAELWCATCLFAQ